MPSFPSGPGTLGAELPRGARLCAWRSVCAVVSKTPGIRACGQTHRGCWEGPRLWPAQSQRSQARRPGVDCRPRSVSHAFTLPGGHGRGATCPASEPRGSPVSRLWQQGPWPGLDHSPHPPPIPEQPAFLGPLAAGDASAGMMCFGRKFELCFRIIPVSPAAPSPLPHSQSHG